jgi:transposase
MGRHGDHSLACYRIGEAQSSQRLPPFELSGTVRALAKNLRKLWPALWTFAEIPDVDPTNNAAERGLRAAVIYGKLSLGRRSQGGERAPSNGCSPWTRPVGCNAARSAPSSPKFSPPKPAATLFPPSPDEA